MGTPGCDSRQKGHLSRCFSPVFIVGDLVDFGRMWKGAAITSNAFLRPDIDSDGRTSEQEVHLQRVPTWKASRPQLQLQGVGRPGGRIVLQIRQVMEMMGGDVI
jgi:hypothetical protein